MGILSEVVREQVARGAALLLSSHQLDLVADVCSAVLTVDRGRVVLRGDVAELRSASATRYVDVEFGVPTAWVPPDGETGTADGLRHRVAVDARTDADALIADARTRGDVVGFSFTPPDLSEVFAASVGRDTVEATG